MQYLQNHPEGTDDDELAKALNLNTRQQANKICRQLQVEELVERRRVNGKIHNFWLGGSKFVSEQIYASKSSKNNSARNITDDWHWEGNVQAVVVKYLTLQDYKILSVADTAARQRGKDIIAEKKGKRLWISAKGYPKGTANTPASTQATHYFRDAVFDIIKYRGENELVNLGIAIPDFRRYRTLAEQITWLKNQADYKYYFVRVNGDVSVE